MPWVETLPSGKYRARYYLPDGSKRSVKTHFTHKRAAQNAAAAAEEKANSLGWRDPKASARPWGEWCAEWWPTRGVEPGTAKRDRSSRDSCLMPRWSDVALIDITRHEVKAWAAELARGGMAPATVQRRLYLLSASLNAAVDAELIQVNPAAKISLPHGQTDTRRYLTRAETERLLDQFDNPTDRTLVNTLLNTGMRWGEVVGLQVPRIDFKRGIIRVAEVWDDEMRRLKPYPKGRKIRDVPLPDWLAELLQTEVAGRATGHVFLRNGRVFDHSNWRYRLWVDAAKEAGLEGTRIHDLRHTYASWLLQAGIPLAEVGRLLGHVSPATTQIYAHLAEVPHDAVLAALTPVSPQRSGGSK